MTLAFTIASPSVWLNSLSYTAVFVSLPIYIILAVSLVLVFVAGEIDLSFASVVGVAALVFSEFVLAGWNPYLCLVLAILINNNFYPTVGDGYLLIVLAAIFVGGTAGIGGVGTVAGAVVGAFTVGFIDSGIVAAGLTGYWTQFIYGIVIVLSLVTHRLYSPHYKK